MKDLFCWLFSGINPGLTLAAIAALFPIFQFFLVRRRESQDREFTIFHSLIERLVSPEKDKPMMIDRQIAVIFELRHFKRYFECTQRILSDLKAQWYGQEKSGRIIAEIDFTLAYISKRRKWRHE